MKLTKAERRKNIEVIANFVALFLIPIVIFYLMECYTHNPFEEVRSWAQFFNIILFELMAWLVFFLSGSIRFAIRTETVIAMIYGIANAYVVRFRTNPIVPWDFFSWKTAASVAGNYDFTPDTRMVVVTLVFAAMLVLVHWLKIKINQIKIWKRLMPAAGVILVLVLFAGRLQDEEFQTSHRLYPFLFTLAHMTNVNGVAVTFVMDLAYVTVEKPSRYDADEMQNLLEKYQGADDNGANSGKDDMKNPTESEAQTGNAKSAEELPNIIAVMNEAFSDVAVLGDFKPTEDYMPYLHSLQEGAENTITGTVNVSVCGGNTANSEFEFLTGNSMAFLPQGSIPYQQYITEKIPALPAHLASLGYETVATHPYGASGWERDTVYPLLGFADSIFKDEYSGASYVRQYVSDDSCVNKIIQIYEQKPEHTPLFLFQVTMQNHGGYTDVYENFTADIKVDNVSSISLEQYLSLVKLSDEALEKLISYFANEDEKTVVVFFGDHQPNDTVASMILKLNGTSVSELDEEELKMRYEVPYVIWANYDIEEKTEADTSLNYLAANVLKAAGVPTTAYQNYLLELEKTYPVISAMRVKKADGTDTNALAEKAGLLEYQSLQYYQLLDQN